MRFSTPDRPGREQPTRRKIRKGTRVLGFDEAMLGKVTITNTALAQTSALVIFTVPKNVDRGELTGIGVVGWPHGFFYNGVSWQLRTNAVATPEHIQRSHVDGALPDINQAGMRWAPTGSLERLQPVNVELVQGEEVSIAFTWNWGAAVVGTPIVTVAARAVGDYYFSRGIV